MTRLLIAGAGGFGRELAAYARDAGFTVVGFLDDNPAAAAGLAGADAEAGVIATIRGWEPEPEITVAIGLGHGATRVTVGDALVARGAVLASIVHPTAWVAPTAALGTGVALAPFTCVGPGVRIGDFSMLNTYASLGHDAQLGRGVVMASYSVGTGFSVLEDEAFLATHAVITPGQRVGRGARISAGAVVFSEIPAGHLALGNPARSRAIPEGHVIVVAILFWVAAFLLVFAQIGYPVTLLALVRVLRRGADASARASGRPAAGTASGDLPFASIIVPAYAEETTIAARVANLKGLDYPGGFEVIISVDGSPDRTAANARAAGADLVLERPREGKVRAQDAAVDAAGEVLAFGDANSVWEPGALRALAAALAGPRVGYVCGDVRFVNEGGTNQEGLYWRYEMAIRRMESSLRSVTAGNGAIYATRRDTYMKVDDVMGHDLSFPFNMVKRGHRAIYEPAARATEKMVPSLEGEFARKRRFMGHTWPILIRGGLLSPFGYDPLYAFMVFSHRALRYGSPALHLLALIANVGLVAGGQGWVYDLTLALQLGLLGAAALAAAVPARPLLVARYYVLSTASIAAGWWDWVTHKTAPGWEPVQEIR